MAQITIEQIDAKQTELSKLIDKFKLQAQAATLTMPATVIQLLPGERYLGPLLNEDGTVECHLVFVARNTHELSHSAQLAWAKSLDAKVASKREMRLVQANAGDLLPSSGWCWLEEENGSSFAWYCGFGYGDVGYFDRSCEGSAVAVRRLNP